MRMVDADAVLETIQQLRAKYTGADQAIFDVLRAVEKKVNGAATIERHAYWIPYEEDRPYGVMHRIRCSRCGDTHIRSEYKRAYCEQCGSVMNWSKLEGDTDAE